MPLSATVGAPVSFVVYPPGEVKPGVEAGNNISCIEVTDHTGNVTRVSILDGGLGATNVTLRYAAHKHSSVNYTTNIYSADENCKIYRRNRDRNIYYY